MPFQTLTIVPKIGERRFSTVEIGSRAAGQVREEFSLLRRVVAALCEVEPEALEPAHVARLDLEKLRAIRTGEKYTE
jgi:hypothetical protein